MTSSVVSMSSTFVASLRSIGTALTMALTGYYLHRTGSIGAEGKRTLAVLAQQVTVPLFLFSKLIYCNNQKNDLSDNEPCPDVTKSLADVWMLLFWPIYVVGVGLLIGAMVAQITHTPKHHVRTVLAACAFGNSTGLPITLLHVIHSNFPSTSDLGRIDPTLFLSVFLLPYPILLWGLGGYLVAPQDETVAALSAPETLQHTPTDVISLRKPDPTVELLNIDEMNCKEYKGATRNQRLSSTDDSSYALEHLHSQNDLQNCGESDEHSESVRLLLGNSNRNINQTLDINHRGPLEPTANENTDTPSTRKGSMWYTVKQTVDRCLQPPVIGAIAGIICASIPWLRGLFVNLNHRDIGSSSSSVPPLQFLFDGLYAIGTTAVPLNMMLMGCNLSSSPSTTMTNSSNTSTLSIQTMAGIVIGKMILMPLVGIVSALLLKNYIWDIPDDIDAAFYLVLMIVFLTPTANNVIIMVELSGSGAKEGISRVIALQYIFAPIILSFTMTIAIGVASG